MFNKVEEWAVPDRRSAGSTKVQPRSAGKQSNGDTAWRQPKFSAIHRIIENPVYGGAYAYSKTAVAAGYTAEA